MVRQWVDDDEHEILSEAVSGWKEDDRLTFFTSPDLERAGLMLDDLANQARIEGRQVSAEALDRSSLKLYQAAGWVRRTEQTTTSPPSCGDDASPGSRMSGRPWPRAHRR